ncbi:MAG: hypothetical protein DID89_2727546115 [Candidatus Nitrotoga sp. CP45]|nr:MAG: hypothetical protein DID89_2727546115 [Candidatus Nitrotoga sp. CP45]
MDIDWNKFSVVVFIDSNVALECLALEQLPWREVHNTGPILVLLIRPRLSVNHDAYFTRES